MVEPKLSKEDKLLQIGMKFMIEEIKRFAAEAVKFTNLGSVISS